MEKLEVEADRLLSAVANEDLKMGEISDEDNDNSYEKTNDLRWTKCEIKSSGLLALLQRIGIENATEPEQCGC